MGDFINSFFYDFLKSKFPKKRTFKVVGIFNSGFVDFDKNFSFTNLEVLQRINGWDKDDVGGIELILKKSIQNF